MDILSNRKLKNNNLFIKTIGIHPAYNNLGIGRIALQTLENYAITRDLETMSLKEQKCFVPLKPGRQKVLRETGDNPKINITQKYFDKNFLVHFFQGFQQRS